MTDSVQRRCSRCILPEKYIGISFDSEGVCNFCREYHPVHRNLGKDALSRLLHSRTRGGPYDCVVPLSGGKDSTFILHCIVRNLGLSPIALSYDSGFQTEFARENVRNACNRLGVPLIVVQAPGESQTRLLREWIQLSAKVGELYGPCGGNCEAILRTASIEAARRHRAPFVIWGSSALESKDYASYINRGKRLPGRAARRLAHTASRLNSLANDWSKARRIPKMLYSHLGYHAVAYDLASISQRVNLGFPPRYALRPRYVPPFTDTDPQFVHFFDYVPWDSITGIKVLEDELNWRHPDGRESRFDCLVHCLGNHQHVGAYGISADGANYCNFIREGRMDREAAMRGESAVVGSIDDEVQELLERVGLKGH